MKNREFIYSWKILDSVSSVRITLYSTFWINIPGSFQYFRTQQIHLTHEPHLKHNNLHFHIHSYYLFYFPPTYLCSLPAAHVFSIHHFLSSHFIFSSHPLHHSIPNHFSPFFATFLCPLPIFIFSFHLHFSIHHLFFTIFPHGFLLLTSFFPPIFYLSFSCPILLPLPGYHCVSVEGTTWWSIPVVVMVVVVMVGIFWPVNMWQQVFPSSRSWRSPRRHSSCTCSYMV